MNSEEDIKIASGFDEKKYNDLSNNEISKDFEKQMANGNIEKGRKFGNEVADLLIDSIDKFAQQNQSEDDFDLRAQCSALLAFSAVSGFERLCKSNAVLATVKSSFFEIIQQKLPETYRLISEMSAFSFYYLAFRRGIDVERRIGQTFAMLCYHDGDPIYQEIGETIYCWFSDLIDKTFQKNGIIL